MKIALDYPIVVDHVVLVYVIYAIQHCLRYNTDTTFPFNDRLEAVQKMHTFISKSKTENSLPGKKSIESDTYCKSTHDKQHPTSLSSCSMK